MQSTTEMTLNKLSLSVRVLFSCFLVTIGVGYLTAVFYLFVVEVQPYQKMGLTMVEGITAKYHGQRSSTQLETALHGSMSDKASPADAAKIVLWIRSGALLESYPQVAPIFEQNCNTCHSAKSGLQVSPLTTYEEVVKVAQIDTGPTLGQLAQVSHVHIFGISMIVLLTGGIFALSGIPVKWRLPIIVLPFFAMWADIGSWWATKYEPVFAYVVLIGGGLMGLALALQILISLWEMWFAPPQSGGIKNVEIEKVS